MAVRFLPGPEASSTPAREDRADIAEVIELRSRLPRLTRQSPPAAVDQAMPGGVVERDRSRDTADPGTLGAVLELKMAPDADADAEGLGEGDGEGEGPLSFDEAFEACKADGVRLLARQARSSGELRDGLLRLEHDRSVVDEVIDEFERSLYLDDVGLARAATEKLRESKRASRGQIRTKLRERQIRDDVIEAVLGELDDEQELELLRDAAAARAQKLQDLDRQTAERRLSGFLARRGWSGEQVSRVVREALDDAGITRSGAGGLRGGGSRGSMSRGSMSRGGARGGGSSGGVRFQ